MIVQDTIEALKQKCDLIARTERVTSDKSKRLEQIYLIQSQELFYWKAEALAARKLLSPPDSGTILALKTTDWESSQDYCGCVYDTDIFFRSA